ncbi:MAG: glycosyltransferase family 4 protein [Planctomycetes bacterium]|nr:glycosyltransferase family 4 protein [Planctomycetota bacterium]
MRVLIDAHTFSVDRPTGVSLYILRLLYALSKIDEQNEYIILVNAFRREYTERTLAVFAGLGRNFEVETSDFPSALNRRFRDWLWYDLYLPCRVRRAKPDVLFCPDFVAPARVAGPLVVTVHDLCPILFPEFSNRSIWHAPQRQIGNSIAKANFVIADSKCTRRDIKRTFNTPEEKIVTVHLAADSRFRTIPVRNAREEMAERYGVRRPFAFCVGGRNPRKNLQRLLAAFALARRDGRVRHELVIAGPDVEPADAQPDGVTVIGYVPVDDLVKLYNAADFSIFPSLYEGFGIPIVEAMRCGAPVLTSDRGAMKEVAGGAAMLADPTDVRALMEGIVELASNAGLRKRLRGRGLRRAKAFSWDETARKTLSVLERAAS